MSEQPLFADAPLPSAITQFALQIASNFEGGDHYACATGVIVAPHLAFTAKHVLDDHWQRHHGEKLPAEPAVTVNLMPPEIGEHVVAFGYSESEAEVTGRRVPFRFGPA